MIIPMRQNHIELIKSNEKTTTLRSLKEVYPLGINELPNKEKINIRERELLSISDEKVISLDSAKGCDLKKLAKTEGYKSWEEVLKVLKKMRHKFPKEMWLYKFEYIKRKV